MTKARIPNAPPILPGTADWVGALIQITVSRDASIFRPAAFVFDLRLGIAWVEPSYADPYGAAAPSLHIRFGRRIKPTEFESGRERIEVIACEREADRNLAGDSIDWFERWLASEGRTYASERMRVWSLIRSDARLALQEHLDRAKGDA